jgi:hypothetical protein
MKTSIFFFALVFSLAYQATAQYKSFKISVRGDTINAVDTSGWKQGPWVVHVDPLRGEPGYEEEGYFVDNKKEGKWRRYTLSGDFIALENYSHGDKDGKSQYFNDLGNLIREENWHAYNPETPYDTIPIYGQGNDEIISYKIVKAAPYSVKDGDWTWYDPQTGMIAKTEKYDRGHLITQKSPEKLMPETPMEKIVPKEVIEFEKKNSGKKGKLRDGRTSN